MLEGELWQYLVLFTVHYFGLFSVWLQYFGLLGYYHVVRIIATIAVSSLTTKYMLSLTEVTQLNDVHTAESEGKTMEATDYDYKWEDISCCIKCKCGCEVIFSEAGEKTCDCGKVYTLHNYITIKKLNK